MQNIPLLGIADTQLDPQTAMGLAEQVLAEPRGLMTTFNTSKVYAEATQRFPTGFTYRSYLKSWAGIRMRMNDGYVTVQDNGQGGTRVSFHENKRYAIIMGACMAAYLVILLLVYFLAFGSSTPPPPPAPGMGGFQQQFPPPQPVATGSNGLWWLIPGIFVLLAACAQMFDILTAPKKVIELFNQRMMWGGQPQPGFPGQPHPGFPGQPQPGFPGQPHGFPGQPHGGLPGQPQPAFPAQPQPGYPNQPQGGFRPYQPQGGFPPPQPQPGAFPPHQPHQGGFPPHQQGGQPPHAGVPLAKPADANAEIDNKLRELAQLRDSGVISPSDYEQGRAALEAKRT
jgi:hypothetical protein